MADKDHSGRIELAEFKALFANLDAPAKLQVRFRAKREQREKFYLKAEARISQGQNLAVAVLYVPSLLESGCGGTWGSSLRSWSHYARRSRNRDAVDQTRHIQGYIRALAFGKNPHALELLPRVSFAGERIEGAGSRPASPSSTPPRNSRWVKVMTDDEYK